MDSKWKGMEEGKAMVGWKGPRSINQHTKEEEIVRKMFCVILEGQHLLVLGFVSYFVPLCCCLSAISALFSSFPTALFARKSKCVSVEMGPREEFLASRLLFYGLPFPLPYGSASRRTRIILKKKEREEFTCISTGPF
jgi:hypothetical protein